VRFGFSSRLRETERKWSGEKDAGVEWIRVQSSGGRGDVDGLGERVWSVGENLSPGRGVGVSLGEEFDAEPSTDVEAGDGFSFSCKEGAWSVIIPYCASR
jgi:hypothetical protein